MRTLFLAAAAALVSNSALACDGHCQNNSTDYLQVGAGYFDVLDGDETAATLNLEYHYKDIYYGLRPIVGLMGTSDSAVYGYAGARWDVELGSGFIVAPSFAAGGYTHGDEDSDLGYGLEFRSGIELAYQFTDASRAAVSFSHISNASLGNRNPGTEILQASYALPLNSSW